MDSKPNTPKVEMKNPDEPETPPDSLVSDLPPIGDAVPSKPPESSLNSATQRPEKSLIAETFEKFGINSFLESKNGDDGIASEESPDKKQTRDALAKLPDYSHLVSLTLAFPSDFFN